MLLKIDRKYIRRIIPTRAKLSSKIDGGRVIIVAGGAHFRGAGILSAMSATRSGAGYTHLMTDLIEYPWAKFPDFILHKMGIKELKNNKNSVIAIGPGLGLTKNKEKLFSFLVSSKAEKVIVDADALTLLSKRRSNKIPESWILTPHEGELGRLLNVASSDIKKDREQFLKKAHEKYGCTILLKGHETLVIHQGKIVVVSNGSNALAKAGTGDVLLGMIAAFYAQGLSPLEASVLGAYVHGEASKRWMKKGNDHLGLRPVDLIEEIPKTLLSLRKN